MSLGRGLSVAVALFFCAPRPARTQQPVDSLDLMIRTWEAIAGLGPLDHPAGEATIVCMNLDPTQPRGRGGVAFPDLSAELVTAFVERLERDSVLDVRDDCRFDRGEPHGWMKGGDGAPAARVTLRNFGRTEEGTWYVGFGIHQGGLWGRSEVCLFEPDAESGALGLSRCLLTAIN